MLRLRVRYALLIFFFLAMGAYWATIGMDRMHDWGDDFAQYIRQAQLILEAQPATSGGYIYKDYAYGLGPPSYPAGFPLLLLPIVAYFGNSIIPLLIWIGILGVCAWFAVFFFYRKLGLPVFVAVCFIVLMACNRHILFMKTDIGSDFSFLSLVFLFMTLKESSWQRYSFLRYFLLGIMLVFALLLRSAGITLLAATAIAMLYDRYCQNRSLSSFFSATIYAASIMVISILGFYLINHVWLGAAKDDGYIRQLFLHGRKDLWIVNIQTYAKLTAGFFFHISSWNLLVGTCIWLMAFVGWILDAKHKLRTHHVFFIIYAFLLCIWPHAAYRFLLPLIPLLVLYLFRCIYWIYAHSHTVIFLSSLLLAIGVSLHSISVQRSYLRQGFLVRFDGPYDSLFLEAADAVQQYTAKDDVVIFRKPRVMALFAHRKSFVLPDNGNREQCLYEMKKEDAAFIFIDKATQEYQEQNMMLISDTLLFSSVWANSRFELFRLRE